MQNHPVVFSEIKIGSLVALIPETMTIDNPFWLAKVIRIDNEDQIIHLLYYEEDENHKWKEM